MKLRKHRASRFDKPNEHASFGIYNYMIKHGVSDKDQQEEVINAFMNISGTKGTDKLSKAQVIQVKFREFAKFFKDYKKTFFTP